MLFHTRYDQRARIPAIEVAMRRAGLDGTFVRRCCAVAAVDQGVFDLLDLWRHDVADRPDIELDLHAALHDYEKAYR